MSDSFTPGRFMGLNAFRYDLCGQLLCNADKLNWLLVSLSVPYARYIYIFSVRIYNMISLYTAPHNPGLNHDIYTYTYMRCYIYILICALCSPVKIKNVYTRKFLYPSTERFVRFASGSSVRAIIRGFPVHSLPLLCARRHKKLPIKQTHHEEGSLLAVDGPRVFLKP